MKRFNELAIALLLATLLGPVACSENASEPAVPPAEALVVRLTPEYDTLAAGDSRVYTATVTSVSGGARIAPVTWSSMNTDVATVQNGTVTAIAAGTTQIIARAGTSADTSRLVVYSPLLELRISPIAVAASLGDTIAFEATLIGPEGAATRATPTWSVSDTMTAQLVSAGVVETRSEGDVEVVATVGGRTAVAQMRILQSPVHTLTITPSALSQVVGDQTQLTATATDDRGRVLRDVRVSWSSANTAVATVSGTGVVDARAKGGTTITARASGKSATATINVSDVPSAYVVLTLPNDSIAAGQTMQATATAYDANGNPLSGRPMAWQSSQPSVATINNLGKITAIVPGVTTISVISDGHVASKRLTVVTGRATSMVVSPPALTLSPGSSGRLVGEIRDQFGMRMPGLSPSWSSSAPSIATVDQTGNVTGIAMGTATVRATFNALTASADITVGGVPVHSIRLTPSSVALQVGGATTIVATALDASGNPLTNRPIAWSSSDPTVATVATSGLVTAVATGSATLTAASGGVSATAPVTVSAQAPAPVATVQVTLNASTIAVGQTTQAVAKAFDAGGTEIFGRPVTFASADLTVANVSNVGLVAGLGGGTTAISATIDGVVGYASLTVTANSNAPVATVTISASPTQFPVGDSSQTTVILRDAQGNILNRTVAYASSKPTIASVNLTGLVKGLAAGDVLIAASSGGKTGVLLFEIDSAPPTQVPVGSVAVALSSATLTVGQGTQATATVRDTAGNIMPGQTVTWSSSNAAVATVSQTGYVTSVSAGSANIVATAGGKSGASSVTVQPASSLPVASVQVTLSNGSVYVGNSVFASATARDAQGGVVVGRPVTWSVTNTAIATVGSTTAASTTVTGVAPGSTTVRAVVDGVTGNANITVAAAPPPSPVTPPVLPQIITFTYPQVTGQTWVVKPTDNLQTILNQAKRGDEIVLPAGATFTGNFSLPNKTGTAANGWIIIRSDKSNQLPPQGTRVRPTDAALMPKIVTNNVSPALATALPTSGWWVSGVEITVIPTLTAIQYGLVTLGDGGSKQGSLSLVPSDIVLDRVYLHGQPNVNLMRCLSLQSARTAVIDSYLGDCHGKGFDSQAIVGWNGPGPFKIVNNTLQGVGENIMFGGADPSISNLIPSDIEIRRNYIYTPASWKGVWTKKNLFELKNAQRLLLEENVFEGSWTDGQVGYAFVLKSANQSGRCTWCISRDITLRRNLIRNAGAGMNIQGREGANTYPIGGLLNSLAVEDNVFENIHTGIYLGDAKILQFIQNGQNITVRRNTMTGGTQLKEFINLGSSPSATGLVFEDNIASHGIYGLFHTNYGMGESALQAISGVMSFKNIVLIGPQKNGYPNAVFVPDLNSALATGKGTNPSALYSVTQGVIIP